jgi:hypothetical protein
MADKTGNITSNTSNIDNTGKTKKKRLPKGQRTHTRRLKQEARNPSPVHS